MSKLTIAIPYYKDATYLRIAIESALAQEAPANSFCLLIIDDGERGEAQGVVDAVCPGDERVRCLENETNLGMVGNWNRCLDETTSSLVSLLHADDALEPNYVATQLRIAAANPEATAFFCAARVIDAHGTEIFSFTDWIKRFFLPPQSKGLRDYAIHGEEALRAVMAGNFIMCPTLCFDTSKLGDRRFDNRWRQVQDLDFTARLLLDGDTLVGTHDLAYAYRRHDEGATALQSESGLRFNEEFEVFETIADRAAAAGWPKAAATARRKTIVRLHLLYRALGSAAALRFGDAADDLRIAASRPARRTR